MINGCIMIGKDKILFTKIKQNGLLMGATGEAYGFYRII